MVLSSIAIKQSKGQQIRWQKQTAAQLPCNLPGRTIRFRASDMILNVHSNAWYLSESEACSHACGHFFMGLSPNDGDPIRLNGAFYTLSTILRLVVSSAAKAELGALFLNRKEGMIFVSPLKNWGTRNQKRTSIATTPCWLVSQIIQSSGNAPIQWRCTIFGLAIRWHKGHMQSDGIQDKKILQITRASIMLGLTIKLFAHGTYTKKIHPWYSLGQPDLALWKGVLEPP